MDDNKWFKLLVLIIGISLVVYIDEHVIFPFIDDHLSSFSGLLKVALPLTELVVVLKFAHDWFANDC